MLSATTKGGDSPDTSSAQRDLCGRAADSPCVLVVDDDPGFREAVADALRDELFVVATAGNGKRALEMLRAGLQPSAVILDLWMPILGGETTLSMMKSDAALSAIPVIVMSAAIEKCTPNVEALSERVMKKPVDLDALISVLDVLTHSPPD